MYLVSKRSKLARAEALVMLRKCTLQWRVCTHTYSVYVTAIEFPYRGTHEWEAAELSRECLLSPAANGERRDHLPGK
jgi:hypothetical protein